jgi:hypothetical protein
MYGTHPAAPAPRLRCETAADGSRLLVCGEDFDVLWVPEPAGRWALRRLIGYRQPALAPGPVARSADREALLYLVAPGARDDLPELLEWLDWGGIDLGLRGYGAGDRLPEPAEWLHPRESPAPEVVALLATIAQCCSRRLLRAAVPRPRPHSEPEDRPDPCLNLG